jgi:iron complex outermembrane receptor protein
MNQQNRNNGPFPLSGTVEEAFASPYVIEQNAVAKMIDNTLKPRLQYLIRCRLLTSPH